MRSNEPTSSRAFGVGHAAWDGHLPWPRLSAHHPSVAAHSPHAPHESSTTVNSALLKHLVGCQAVQLPQWPTLVSVCQALKEACEQASVGTPSPAQDDTECTDALPANVQPWATPRGMQQQSKVASQGTHTGSSQAVFEYGDISLSGRLQHGGGGSGLKLGQSPLTVACVGAPFYRFLRVQPHQQEHDMYCVRQPEWKDISLTTGSLSELVACMSSWSSTRLLATLDLATLSMPTHGASESSTWLVRMDPGTEARLGADARHMASKAIQLMADWIPQQLLAAPLSGLLQGTADQRSPAGCRWAAASCRLRWWSEGAVEPLRACSTDRCLLQVHGITRVVLVPSSYAMHGLAPFPTQHQYAGYSAPGVAVTSRVPYPSKSPYTQQSNAPAPSAPTDPSVSTDGHQSGTSLSANGGVVSTSKASSESGTAGAVKAPVKPPGLDLQPILNGPSEMYMHEEQLLMEAAGELWPGFASAQGQRAVLHPGDALWVPAGWFVHLESLYTPWDESAHVQQPPSNMAPAGDEAPCPALPGNLMLEVVFTSARVGASPRDLGSLEMRAAELIEGWATQCVCTPARTRQLLLDMADRFEAAALMPGTVQPEGVEQHSGTGSQSTVRPCRAVSWVSWPVSKGADKASPEEAAAEEQQLKALFKPGVGADASPSSHWAGLPSAGAYSLVQAPVPCSTGQQCSAPWEPDWDPSTLDGHRHIVLAKQVLTSLTPLIALGEANQQHPCTTQDMQYSWYLGAKAAAFLRAMCAGRLLPTTWLNKLAHNDPLLLADDPYKYAIEFKSQEEVDFPDLFKPQLARRERKAKAAAEAAHLSKLRLASSSHQPLLMGALTGP